MKKYTPSSSELEEVLGALQEEDIPFDMHREFARIQKEIGEPNYV